MFSAKTSDFSTTMRRRADLADSLVAAEVPAAAPGVEKPLALILVVLVSAPPQDADSHVVHIKCTVDKVTDKMLCCLGL